MKCFKICRVHVYVTDEYVVYTIYQGNAFGFHPLIYALGYTMYANIYQQGERDKAYIKLLILYRYILQSMIISTSKPETIGIRK